jgi:hypothetical protein
MAASVIDSTAARVGGQLLDEMIRQKRDVLLALAQGRDV